MREPTVNLSNHFLSYTKFVLLHGLNKKSVRMKETLMDKIEDGRKTILEIKLFNGQETLKNQYLVYLQAMENHLNSLPEVEIEEVENFNLDSARKLQIIQIQQLDLFLGEAKSLKHTLKNFCILNKVIGFKTCGALYAEQKEAVMLISYAVQVKNVLMELRRLNRLFLTSLKEDTGQKPEQVRQEILKQSICEKESLLAIPNFPGDLKVKKSALNNIRLTRIGATGKYLAQVKFRDKELVFRQKMIQFDQNPAKTKKEIEIQSEETKKMAELVKFNQSLRKELNQSRINYENTFNSNFLEFIENHLSVDPMKSDRIAYEKLIF